MTQAEHKKDVEKLSSIEDEVIKLISETNNEPLMNKFIEFQTQRTVCNEGFLAILETLGTPKKKKEGKPDLLDEMYP